jgi:hypothetical protein
MSTVTIDFSPWFGQNVSPDISMMSDETGFRYLSILLYSFY